MSRSIHLDGILSDSLMPHITNMHLTRRLTLFVFAEEIKIFVALFIPVGGIQPTMRAKLLVVNDSYIFFDSLLLKFDCMVTECRRYGGNQ